MYVLFSFAYVNNLIRQGYTSYFQNDIALDTQNTPSQNNQ